jgi:hypothetical protein
MVEPFPAEIGPVVVVVVRVTWYQEHIGVPKCNTIHWHQSLLQKSRSNPNLPLPQDWTGSRLPYLVPQIVLDHRRVGEMMDTIIVLSHRDIPWRESVGVVDSKQKDPKAGRPMPQPHHFHRFHYFLHPIEPRLVTNLNK